MYSKRPANSKRNLGSATPDPNHRAPAYQPMRTLETSGDELVQEQKNIYKQLKSNALDKLAKEEYQPALYSKALRYRNQRSYLKKINEQYKEIGILDDTDELRYFGLGPYFYIQFFRRLCWLFLVMTLIQAITIYINYKGIGLQNYSLSFSSYLIKTTIGNYSGQVFGEADSYIIIFAPFASFLAVFFFYLIWKVHYHRTISVQQSDNKDVKPQKFCIQFQGLPQDYIHESDLQKFFTSFGPVYEVSVVRNYQNNLPYFQELDELQQEIREEELQLVLGGDNSNRKEIAKKKTEKAKLERELQTMHIRPTTVSAYVHFQFQKSKLECLNYFNDHYLFTGCAHGCARTFCCCCIKSPDQRAIFYSKPLYVNDDQPPTPSDINWEHYELGACSKFLRASFACLIILFFLCLSCAIIGICGVYISSHSSNCDGIDTSTFTATTAAATGDSAIIRCYCNANLVASFTDDNIKTTCNDYLDDIYVQQIIQYVVLITEGLTNVLFGCLVNKLVNCVRPSSQGSGLILKTVILTIFLCLNSIVIPILIYAQIFGFQPSSYVSFLTIISTDLQNFLSVSTLSFYPSFSPVWYRNVSPIFTNYMIFNTIIVWLMFVFQRCCCINKQNLEEDEGKVLQKTMNRKITDFKLDVYKEASNLYLVCIMGCLFGAGIPALIPLVWINILSRYIINRSLLQTYSTQIQGLGDQFSSFSLLVLSFILLTCPLVGQYMLISNGYIYPTGLSTDFTWPSFLTGHLQELDKQLYLPFYVFLSFVVLCEIVLYFLIVKFCSCVCSCCYQKKEINYHPRPFGQYTKSINILSSYNIRNNDLKRNAILHMEKYLINNTK